MTANSEKEKISHNRVRDMAYTALFAVVIAVCSWISVPFVIPFTLQTFAVFCAVLILGSKRSFLSVLVYMLMGVVGLPVFSGFNSGFGALFGITGGYIIGFLFIPVSYMIFTYAFDNKTFVKILGLIVGLAVCYAFGTLWFVYVYSSTKGTISIISALSTCVFPYIVPDMIKLFLAFSVSKALQKHIKI